MIKRYSGLAIMENSEGNLIEYSEFLKLKKNIKKLRDIRELSKQKEDYYFDILKKIKNKILNGREEDILRMINKAMSEMK